MSRLGEALAQLLHERGLTQADLARRLGITASAVNLWVNGRAKPSRDNITRLEDELAIEPRGHLHNLAGYTTDNDGDPTIESLIRSAPDIAAEDKRVLLRVVALARERHTEPE